MMSQTSSRLRWVATIVFLSSVVTLYVVNAKQRAYRTQQANIKGLATEARQRAFENGELAEFPVHYLNDGQWQTKVIKTDFVSVQAPDCDDSTNIARFQNPPGFHQDIFFILNDTPETKIEAQEILVPSQRVEWHFKFDRTIGTLASSPFATQVSNHPRIKRFRMQHYIFESFAGDTTPFYEYGTVYYDRKDGFYQYSQRLGKKAEFGNFDKVTPKALNAMSEKMNGMEQHPDILKRLGARVVQPRPELSNIYE